MKKNNHKEELKMKTKINLNPITGAVTAMVTDKACSRLTYISNPENTIVELFRFLKAKPVQFLSRNIRS